MRVCYSTTEVTTIWLRTREAEIRAPDKAETWPIARWDGDDDDVADPGYSCQPNKLFYKTRPLIRFFYGWNWPEISWYALKISGHLGNSRGCFACAIFLFVSGCLILCVFFYWPHKLNTCRNIQGGSNMTGTDLCVNKPHCAAAVRP